MAKAQESLPWTGGAHRRKLGSLVRQIQLQNKAKPKNKAAFGVCKFLCSRALFFPPAEEHAWIIGFGTAAALQLPPSLLQGCLHCQQAALPRTICTRMEQGTQTHGAARSAARSGLNQLSHPVWITDEPSLGSHSNLFCAEQQIWL